MDRQLESKAVTDRPGSGMLPGAARAVQRAVAEAAELGHEYVGTEHLLLGLLAEPGAARDVITAFGGDYSAARNSALELLNGPHVGMRRGRARASLR